MLFPQQAGKTRRSQFVFLTIRKQAKLTQAEAAKAMGVTQTALSHLESQDDMYVSTLRRLIEALGGTMEITANLPTGPVVVGQFKAVERS